MIGMALFAILMCVNLASCSSSDDDPTEKPEEGGAVVSSKKLTKIVGTGVYENETYTFNYDSKGRLIESIYTEGPDGNIDVVNKKYTWSDDNIKVDWESGSGKYTYSCTLTFENELIKDEKTNNESVRTFTYNNSNKIIKIEKDNVTTAVWNGDKLTSISTKNTNNWTWNYSLIYEKSCKKGYFPFIAEMLGGSNEVLFMAHPEIAGMKTTQLPSTATQTYDNGVYGSGSEIIHFYYEFDNDGYISKIEGEVDGEPYAYTLTWK